MTAVYIVPADLEPFADIASAKALAMIDDAMATAVRVAPCIMSDDFAYGDAAKAIIRRAIIRWNDAGSGATSTVQQAAGPFSQMQVTQPTASRGRLFWPSEITDLQELCLTGAESSGAFNINTAPTVNGLHLPWCDLMFGGTACSCGVNIAGYPIFEQ